MAKITIKSLQAKIAELEGQKAALSQDLLLALGLIPSWVEGENIHQFLYEETMQAQTEMRGRLSSIGKIAELPPTANAATKLPGGDLVPGGREFEELCQKIGFGLQGLSPDDKKWVASNVTLKTFGRKTVVWAPSPEFLRELAFCATESGFKSLISDNKKITIW